MAITVTMPALSPTMEEGALSKWLVAVGDSVSAGDVLAEIETDKAVMEVESVDEGTVARLLVEAGTQGVRVNAPIALIAVEGEDIDSVELPAASEVVEAAPFVSEPEEAVVTAAEAVGVSGGGEPREGAIIEDKIRDRIRISPLARRVARERGVDIATVTGTGPHGRIVMRDLEGLSSSAVVAGTESGSAGLDPRVYPKDSYELEAMDAMGRVIADRLTASASSIPHFSLSRSLCLDALLSARRVINERSGIRVSVTDMLVRASALALVRVPECNVSYVDGGSIARHRGAHVSVAVALEAGGLMTPVVRDAHAMSVGAISEVVRDLVDRARERRLKPEEYAGGSFSLSNLGMFGIERFTSILNPPEAMILSVGAGVKRAVVDQAGELSVAVMMDVTLTSDHRVVSGAQAAMWLAEFAGMVEHPETMLV